MTLPFLPESIPNAPFTIAYIFIARYVADNYQLKKHDILASDVYDFSSNWRVFGLSLLCLVGSVLALMGPIMLLIATGIWEPA